MKGKFVLLVWSAAVSVAAQSWAADLCTTPVKTASGQVVGQALEGTEACSWLGIPFAAPPVGELRFKAPQPAPAWEGVREAKAYGDQCWQVLVRGDDKLHMSEDCLYLNVWRPQAEGKLPVMVWIHGGGYIMGSGGRGGSGLGYEGADLTREGVVVVTLNYRLHAFGFYADPALREEDPHGSTGNYGSLDQAFALDWVQKNIAAFGGDPANVTIFGESAGGWSICTMLATPLNAGKFQRAILESGGCTKSETFEAGYKKFKPIAERVGCKPGDLPCLRSAPAEKFIGNVGDLYREGMMYGPHVDGYLLTASPLEMIRAGNYNHVPFIAGSNRNETDITLIFRPALWHAPPWAYERRLKRHLRLSHDEADQLVALYPRREFGFLPRRGYGRIYTDAGLACPTYLGLSGVAAHQEPAWLYRFDYDDTKFGKHIGALHALEVPMVFGNLPAKLYPGKKRAPAEELSKIMQGYWTNFAKTGDPNGAGLPAWPQFDNTARQRMIFDATLQVEKDDMAERCEFWDGYARDHRPFEEGLGRRDKSGGKP